MIDIKTKITSSNWPDAVKNNLISAASSLGKWAIAHIVAELDKLSSEVIANEIATIILKEPVWLNDLKSGYDEDMFYTISDALAYKQEYFLKAVLAMIIDIRLDSAVNHLVSDRVSLVMDQVEILYLKELPLKEVETMLAKRLLSFLKFSDLKMEIATYCAYQEFFSATDEWILKFKQAVERNEQIIAGRSIKAWVQDFREFSATSQDLSTYNVVNYFNREKSALKVSNADKSNLSNIFILYNWFFNPYVPVSEIQEYQSKRENLILQTNVEQELMKQEVGGDAVSQAVVPEVAPHIEEAPRKVIEQRPVEDIRAIPSATLNENKYTPPVQEVQKKPSQNPFANDPQNIANPAKIFDIINKSHETKAGVIMDPTNIKIEEETKRLSKEQEEQQHSIEQKLQDLKSRSQTFHSSNNTTHV